MGRKYIDFKSKRYARLLFTPTRHSVLYMQRESGEGIAVLNVPHGYSEVSSEGSGGDDKQVFFSSA